MGEAQETSSERHQSTSVDTDRLSIPLSRRPTDRRIGAYNPPPHVTFQAGVMSARQGSYSHGQTPRGVTRGTGQRLPGLGDQSIEQLRARVNAKLAQQKQAEAERAAQQQEPPETPSEEEQQEWAEPDHNSSIDFQLIKRRIANLNSLMSHQKQIYRQGGMNMMRDQDPVVITFYQDGLTISIPSASVRVSPSAQLVPGQSYNYAYSTMRGQQITDDLSAGFLPSPLRALFPNGVDISPIFLTSQQLPVTITPQKQSPSSQDTAADTTNPASPPSVRKAQLAALTESDASDVAFFRQVLQHASRETVVTPSGTSVPLSGAGGLYQPSAPKPAISASQYLQRLPQKIIHNGKVVDVRAEAARAINLKTAEPPLVNPQQCPLHSVLVVSDSTGPQITVRVRVEMSDEPPRSTAVTTTPQTPVNAVMSAALQLLGSGEESLDLSQLYVVRRGKGPLCVASVTTPLSGLGVTGNTSFILTNRL